jgi:phospholipid/cholesterol/gamma-HCH transport system permease protein
MWRYVDCSSFGMAAKALREPPSALAVHADGDRWALDGALDIHTLSVAASALKPGPPASLDIAALQRLDTPGALLLHRLRGQGVRLVGMRAEQRALLELVAELHIEPLPAAKRVARWRELVIQLGRGADEAWRDTLQIITFVGRAASGIGLAIVRRRLRLAALSRQVSETGVNALPIVGLMAVMISIVIGYQGVAQLRPYGSESFTINLVAVSVLREMGVLITAIMVAGRSGSAFTAEIGVMKAREEIDALRVMGLEPMELLVLPRVLGLVITLPLLTFYADVMGLLGGAVISQTLLQVSPASYLERVQIAVDSSDLFVGLVKAPVFAFFIGVIGCMHGLRIAGSAESVGRETTRAVVKAIFLVIVLDALFSVFFEKVGL